MSLLLFKIYHLAEFSVQSDIANDQITIEAIPISYVKPFQDWFAKN